MQRRLPRDEYTVGWICALSVEHAAAKALLDEEHCYPDTSDSQDENIYCTGSIAGHNVVLVCLPAGNIGHIPATATMMQMRATFKRLRFGLMVGIGGGVPCAEADIRLGDIVVSEPRGNFGGVVQYDKGKRTDGRLKPTGHLNAPPRILLNALSMMKSNTLLNKSTLYNHISELEKIPAFRSDNTGPDILFEAAYSHQGGHSTCEHCDISRRHTRPQRRYEERVAVHYGTIASGNQVMRSAIERDKLSAEFEGVLCFEMEAAGLLNYLPCLVIRGICDYSDSHKNKQWQPYASATAAAYAKELLLMIPPADMEGTSLTEDALNGPNKRSLELVHPDYSLAKRTRINSIEIGLSRQTTMTLSSHQNVQNQTSPSHEERTPFLESLKFDQMDARRMTIKTAHAKTCKWLLKNPHYIRWLDRNARNEHNGFLWVKGNPGAGKSTLMKFAMKQVRQRMKEHITLAFFFNARGEEIEKSTVGLYRSLLSQLLEALPNLLDVLDLSDFSSHSDGERISNIELLKDTLEQAITALGQSSVVCFIDALDECDEEQVRDMVQFFEHIGDMTVTNEIRWQVCFSSRHYPHITIREGLELVLEGEEGHTQDIVNYIEAELKIKKSKIAERIRAELKEKASGIFMWVVLVVRILNKESDRGQVHLLQQKLREIPADLHKLFEGILTKDPENRDNSTVDNRLILCIQWVLFAKHRLHPEELYYAIRSGSKEEILSQWNPDDITEDNIRLFILDCSKGLAEVVSTAKTQRVQFIHESVRDFLLKGTGLSRIWPELQNNFEGQSHESLKECCTAYLNIDFALFVGIPHKLPNASSQQAISLRESALKMFPFLEYAVHNVFYHANLAERNGILQSRFLAEFSLPRWVALDNLLEENHISRHTINVSWQYILAELNMAHLLTTFPLADQCMKENDERYGCPLLAAMAKGSEYAVECCLQALNKDHTINVSLLARRPGKTRAFTYSRSKGIWFSVAELGHDAGLKVLLKLDQFDIDSMDSRGRTALWWASSNGCESAVKALLDAGSTTINSKDKALKTPLHAATRYGHTATVAILLEHGADFEAQGGSFGNALNTAVINGHAKITSMLLDMGADMYLQYKKYGNALNEASEMGFQEIVEIILSKGVDINAEGGRYGNALQAASIGGSREIVEILLSKGADVNAKGGWFNSALQAASCKGFQEIVEILLDKGADVNAKGGPYGSALQAASCNGFQKIVEILLEKGADVNAQRKGYFSSESSEYLNALQAAVGQGWKGIVEVLLDNGADINAKGGPHGSILKAATRAGHKEIKKLLLARGALRD